MIFQSVKIKKKLTFHEGSKLGLRFSRQSGHERMIGELDVEEGGEGFLAVVVWWRSVVRIGGGGAGKVGALDARFRQHRRRGVEEVGRI